MLLKKIELNGFKSFADKTTLAILPGVTSIVGPNGCGKTNIVDAISWVLGEQRISLLRGQKMEDVIFNGTSGRPPVGMAEVTLTFDNSDGRLPLDFSEVSVTRRVFRAGDSEYLINKQPCLLRDIRELIMGTGLGNRAYSQVGQGRINQILQARPEERRALLEEAARISRYRKKKQESERKLEHTRSNLLRVDDIIREVKRQLSIARRQARQAERYRNYREELRDSEIRLSLFQLDDIRARSRDLDSERHQWEEKYRQLELEVEKVEEELSGLRRDIREKEEALSALRTSRIARQGEIDGSSHRIELNEERVRELEKEGDRIRGEIRSISASIAANGEESRKLKSDWEEIKAANQEKSAELARRDEALEKSRSRQARAEETLNAYRSRALESSREETRLRNEYMGLKAGNKELLLRKRKLEVESEKIGAEIEETRGAIESAAPAAEDALGKLKELKARLAELKSRSGNMESIREELSRRREENLLAQSDLDSRIGILEEEDGQAALGPIRKLKKLIEQGEKGLEGTVGFLEEFLEIDPGSQSLVRSALAGKENSLIVDNLSSARRILTYLRDNNRGPVGIMVLDLLRSAASSGKKDPGAAEFWKYVRCSGPLRGLEEAIFGSPVLIERIEDLKTPAAPASPRIARPGAALFPGGIIIWAGKKGEAEEADLQTLRRRREMLEAESAGIGAELEKIKSGLIRIRDEIEETGGATPSKRDGGRSQRKRTGPLPPEPEKSGIEPGSDRGRTPGSGGRREE